MWRKRLMDGFRHNRSERNGLWVLAFIVALTAAYFFSETEFGNSRERVSEQIQKARWKVDSIKKAQGTAAQEMFFFDPNKVDSLQLMSLGLPGDVARRWVHYTEKGGRFFKEEDVLKIYGLQRSWWERAKEFMIFQHMQWEDEPLQMPDVHYAFMPDTMSVDRWKEWGLSEAQAYSVVSYLGKIDAPLVWADLEKIYVLDEAFKARIKPWVRFDAPHNGHDPSHSEKLEVNSMSTEELARVSKWPRWKVDRLIAFRDRLGGFHSLAQIYGAYGLDSVELHSLESHLSIQAVKLSKCFVNKEPADSLLLHPYINFTQAYELTRFRENVRPLRNLDEVRRLRVFSLKELELLGPYLSFDL